jgi:carbon-monoxide dehydrogenase small subunit
VGNNIKFILNNEIVELDADPLRKLLDVLREDLNLKGPKEGCSEGECGACAVLIDGLLVNSCIYPVGAAAGKNIVTIEGFRETARYKILSQCFEDAGAVQCGFCTPGMIMAAEALLTKNPHPNESQIREGLSGNLCRCTGYSMIVDAVKSASKRGEGLW